MRIKRSVFAETVNRFQSDLVFYSRIHCPPDNCTLKNAQFLIQSIGESTGKPA